MSSEGGVSSRLPSLHPPAHIQIPHLSRSQRRTKFNYVVSQLNQQQSAEVEDIITSSTEQDPNDRLKAELVHRLSTSREQSMRQLVSHEEMGDRTPSQFLRHPKDLGIRRPRRFSSHHLSQPTPTARTSHTCRPDRGQSLLSLPPQGQNL